MLTEMWPALRSNRARLAAHFVLDKTVDPLTIVNSLAAGWDLTTTNGIVHVAKCNISFEAALAGEKAPPATVPPIAGAALAFHILWQIFPPSVLAAFVQSKQMHSPWAFWKLLGSWVMWIVAAPAAITDALFIGRPDLSCIVSDLYAEWLCCCRSPAIIETQLTTLLCESWAYTTHSHEWEVVQGWIIRAGIMCVAPTPTRPATIMLNGTPCLVLAVRDMVLLALVQLFCTPLAWSVKVPPESAPAQFKALHSELTRAAPFQSPMDELYPQNAYTTRTFA